jgi:putative flavoprotein involved in K+ transport
VTTGALPEDVDVLVVGAGQAGLGAARELLLREPAARVLVLDRGPVGQSWLDRWDSLVLFTPRRWSSLPGRPFPAGPTRTPDRREVADYLRAYAEPLPVRTGIAVERLTRLDGAFLAETSTGPVRASHVVVATGPFSQAHVPPLAAGLAPEVHQLHSSQYCRPADVPPGEVLVVGGGNSAAQLAVELAETHAVTVAAPRRPLFLPVSVLGVDLYRWLDLTGILRAGKDSPVSRAVRRRGDPVIGTELRDLVRRGQVRLLPHRVVAADGDQVRLADGAALAVRTVLWCTGFRPDTSWIDVPGSTGDDGEPLHDRGASPVPGLHWMGLPWQTRLNSSIIDGVAGDARELAGRVSAAIAAHRPAGRVRGTGTAAGEGGAT